MIVSLVILATVLLLVFIYLRVLKPLQYWKEKGIPYVKPWPIVGNMGGVAFRTQPFALILQDIYNKFPNQRYVGCYQFSMPTLLLRDPDLIKQICIKDFDTFPDHLEFLPKSSDPFWSKNLFSMTGDQWRDMRAILSPAFTSSKMKAMFSMISECAQGLANHFQNENYTITLEMKDTFMRFTNDVIASIAYGIKCNSLEDRDNEFFLLGKSAFDFTGIRSLKFFGYCISPLLMKILRVKFFDEYSKNFFLTIVRDTIRHREQTGIIRPDMIHLLKEAQKGRIQYEEKSEVSDMGFAVVQESAIGKAKITKKPEITEEDIAAQAFVFFFGGFDTVAGLLSHCAYELALNPEAQEKLIAEVDKTLEECGGELTYEALLHMKYLDMTVSETLRLWSPAVFINRRAVRPFTIEPKYPGEKPLHIETGVTCWVPVYGIQRDPLYYPNPDKFQPERFSDENKHKIHPFTFIPFGTGPRGCIASRFALMEIKVAIFYLLCHFQFVTVEKTQIPLVLSKKNVNIVNDAGYWLGLKSRKKDV